MKFLVFADFHYKMGMYASTAAHLDAILKRAADEKVDFVVHLGDFCNDYAGSGNIVDAYLNNRYGLPVFGIYGNHELETAGNSMENVTPMLCSHGVHFGASDAGYWHYDIGGYRLIGLDTNYSYNETLAVWQHNAPASWGAPDGNRFSDSLSPEQLDWLDKALSDAHEKRLKALIFSHTGLSGEWDSSPDAETVREIFAKYKGTVLMSLNGHNHTDHFCVIDGVAYFDVNTVLNGYWTPMNDYHYAYDQGFIREKECGGTETEWVALNTLSQAKNTWFFEDPLSAVAEIADDGCIDINGSRTKWKHGVIPPINTGCVKPMIEDRHIDL